MSPIAPVLLIFFNRPEPTRKVFAAIREAQPRHLILASDGPRHDRPGEAEIVHRLRQELEKAVDWPCTLTLDYADKNWGCKRRPPSAITGALQRYAEVIILEDDCVPHPSFFVFCTELLDRYRESPEIRMISGQSFVGIQPPDGVDYFFTRYPHIWGWATWRESWNRYRLDLRHLEEEYRSGEWHRIFEDHPRMARVWYRRWKWCQQEERNSTWDYQWAHACLKSGGLSVAPVRNLVENIGFGPDATHTRIAAEFDAEVQQGVAFPLRHPERVERDRERDRAIADRYFDYSEWAYQFRRIPRLLLPKPVKQAYHRWRERRAVKGVPSLVDSSR